MSTTRPDLSTILATVIGAILVVSILPGLMGMLAVTGSAQLTPTTAYQTVDSSMDNAPGSLTVSATNGNALAFDGVGDTVNTHVGNLTDGSWTLCNVARLSPDANTNATYTLTAVENATVLIQFDAGQWRAYHRTPAGDDATATLAADSPAEWTGVCARYNDTSGELSLMADGTVSDPATVSSATASRNVSHDWYGRADELRTFDAAVDNSTLEAYGNDPVQPLPRENQTARYMFHEGSGDATSPFYASTSADIQGATWTDGVTGPSLDQGSDYRVDGDPFQIAVPSGGYLEGAPTMFLSWDSGMLPFSFRRLVGLLVALVILVSFADLINLFDAM